MLKLVKFLKPFTFLLIITVGLLYVQAMADLALPDYMSNIVNKGIQQGGISHSVPEVIREEDFLRLKLFLSEDEKKLMEEKYEPGERNTYILKDTDDVDQMNLFMAKALLALYSVKELNEQAKETDTEFNGMTVPKGTDFFHMLSNMPFEQRMRMSAQANEQFEAMGDNMVIQAGTRVVRSIYEELGKDTRKIQNRYIINTGLIMLLIAILGAACSISVGFISARVAAGLGKSLRNKIFTKVTSFSNSEIDKFSTASLITRSTNDITQIQMLMMFLIRVLFYAPIIGIGGVFRAMSKSTSMSWIIALAVIILLGLILVVFSIAYPRFKIIQKLIDKLNMVTRENLTGMMVIRAFNTQEFEEQRFDKANQDLTRTNLFINRVMVFMFPLIMLIMNGVTITIIWVGAHQIADSAMQVGDMMAFMQYALQIIMSFLMLSMMFIMVPRAAVSAQRISEVLNVKPSIKDPEKREPLDKTRGELEFKKVSFKYPGAEEDMLKDISFKAKPGEVTAIIGSTGSGKTTLLNLILRFYDVTDGSVSIDGVDIRNVMQHDLRKHIGYIPQKASLFSGNVASNLKLGDEQAEDILMKKACEISQIMDFINEDEKGFEKEISQGGANVSGGQKQRLSIARAIVKKPKIYLFDDSFSALDFKTDSELRKALKAETSDSTVLIVAQRISTIKNADQIIVLEDGKIVGKGTHNELMEKCTTYKEIALSQLSKEELA